MALTMVYQRIEKSNRDNRAAPVRTNENSDRKWEGITVERKRETTQCILTLSGDHQILPGVAQEKGYI